MKLSELISSCKSALEEHGDIDVEVLLDEEIACPECNGTKTRHHECDKLTATPVDSKNSGYVFWIEGVVL